MRIAFLGTSDFAVPPLRALDASPHDVTLVVTQPDRPAGRGRRPQPPPVKIAALDAGLDVFQPERINTRAARAAIRDTAPDVVVVVSFGQILKPLMLSLVPLGCLNIHASLLPRHRGASPIHAAVLAGDHESGVTIMRMDEGLDTGPTALMRSVTLDDRETAGTLHDRLSELGGEMIVEAIDLLGRGELEFTPQPEEGATYAGMLSKTDGALDFSADAVEVDRRVRGLTPWPGAWTDLVREGAARRVIIEVCEPDVASGGAGPGEIVHVDRDAITVACGSGVVRIARLKPAGKRAMSVREFLNGATVEIGDRFEVVS